VVQQQDGRAPVVGAVRVLAISSHF